MLSVLLAGFSAPLLVSALVITPPIVARDVTPVPSTFSSLTACSTIPAFYSCESTTAITNTCCSPTPGGLVLATQFWDTYTGLENVGQFLPENSWTIHGLWPDNCDGSYPGYCDFSRQYGAKPAQTEVTGPNNVTILPTVWNANNNSVLAVLKKFGRYDLIDYMNGFWVNQGVSNNIFWGHEFSKHATCTSTFDIACYGPDYVEGQEVVDFVLAAIRAFKFYPSYSILASAGIIPSNTTTYSLAQLNNAFLAQTGSLPYFGCAKDAQGNKTIFNEIWINAHVYGTPQYGQLKTVDTPAKSSCSNVTGAIHYYERTPSSVVSKYLS